MDLRGAERRRNAPRTEVPCLVCASGPQCQALSPTLAKCDWTWKVGSAGESSLSSSFENGAPKAKGPALKSLEFICGISCRWTGMALQWQRQPCSVTFLEVIWPKPPISHTEPWRNDGPQNLEAKVTATPAQTSWGPLPSTKGSYLICNSQSLAVYLTIPRKPESFMKFLCPYVNRYSSRV